MSDDEPPSTTLRVGSTESNEPADPLVGTRLDKYEIKRLLGAGGMGQVYEAWNTSIERRVAIKVLSPEAQSDREFAARFTREARAASAVESPYIISIFDAGQTQDGRAYIVMELLRGASLGAVLRERDLTHEEILRVATHVLRGLERAHAVGVIHRDLKPENVFLVDNAPEPPTAKILDFGISKVLGRAVAGTDTTLTKKNAILGTPAYMSPEQIEGDGDLDARSDLWSLGALLYECLAGRPPFTGSSYAQVLVRICTTEPVAIETLAKDCPSNLAHVVTRCLTKDRERRFQSAKEILDALGQAPSGAPKEAPVARPRDTTTVGSSLTERAEPAPKGRRGLPLSIVGVLVVATAALALVGARLFSASPAQPDNRAAANTNSAVSSSSSTSQEPVAPNTPVSSALPASATAIASTPSPSSSAAPALVSGSALAKSSASASASASAKPTTSRANVAAAQLVRHCWDASRPAGAPAASLRADFDLTPTGRAQNVRFTGPDHVPFRRCLVLAFDEHGFGAGPAESASVTVSLPGA
ncbi:MAG: serine/threonine-protein kinase [Polyangiaceae bacterium]